MWNGIPTIKPLDPTQAVAWEDYVYDHSNGTLFHLLSWKQAVERAFGHRARYLTAWREGSLVGLFPLFEVHSVLAGRLMVSVPYATYGGILADDETIASALFERACELAGGIQARSIEMRSVRRAVPDLETRHSHVAFCRDLPESEEDVGSWLPRKARAAARRAIERYSLTTEFNPGALRTVWELYARSMRRLGSPNYPYSFFEELANAFGESCLVQLVRCEGKPVAGLLTFLYRDTVLPYFSGQDERQEIYGLNNYLYAESMRWGVQHGYRRYDFGRTRIGNNGSYDFKRFCGFQPQPLDYQVHIPAGQAEPDLSPGSPRWSAARRVWRALPLPLTRPLGAWLAKSIPG